MNRKDQLSKELHLMDERCRKSELTIVQFNLSFDLDAVQPQKDFELNLHVIPNATEIPCCNLLQFEFVIVIKLTSLYPVRVPSFSVESGSEIRLEHLRTLYSYSREEVQLAVSDRFFQEDLRELLAQLSVSGELINDGDVVIEFCKDI